MVDFPIIPQDFAYWRVLLSNRKHLLWITAFCQQLPAEQDKKGTLSRSNNRNGHVKMSFLID